MGQHAISGNSVRLAPPPFAFHAPFFPHLSPPLILRVVSNNFLTGTYPPEWAGLSSITSLFLSLNQFTGDLPREWGQLGTLALL